MKRGDASHTKPTHDDTSGRHGPSPLLPHRPASDPSSPLSAADPRSAHRSLQHITDREKTLEELIVEHYNITVEAFETGKTAAFEELVDRVKPWIKHPIASFAREFDLDDITQEVLMDVFNQAPVIRERNKLDRAARATHDKDIEHIHPMPPAKSVVETDAAGGSTQTTNGRFDPDRGVAFKSWFSRLLYYKALTMLAKKKRRLDLDHLLRWVDECQNDADLHVFVKELLAGLSKHEEAIARRHAAGETFSAIGHDLNLSTSSVHKTYRSAVEKMRAVASIARSEH